MSGRAAPLPVAARRRAGLRWLLPRDLLGRSLLIVLGPLLGLQVVALLLFYGGHLDVISRRLSGAVAGDVAMIAELMRREPESERHWIFREAAWRLDLSLAFEAGAVLTPVERRASLPLLPLEGDLERALRERLRLPFDTDWQSDPRSVIVRVQLADGVLHAEAPRKRLYSQTLYLFVIWLVGTAALLAVVAFLFLKNQVRAIRRLAAAAEAFDLGRDRGPIKPEGATEVRQAALAFNRMRERIRRFVAQRTDLLAGVSHDLRTPLTRMRLGLAMLPTDPRSAEDVALLAEDVAEMERMVASYLSFARGEATEQATVADLARLVRDVAADARRTGAAVVVSAPDALLLPFRADALRRCLGNLIDNARRHAARIVVAVAAVPRDDASAAVPRDEAVAAAPRDEASAAVPRDEAFGAATHWAQVIVDDDGPGIPETAREDVFRPFASDAPDGTGLGLAIARDIVRAHGGELSLEDSPLGGLRARVRLPV